MQPYQFGLFRSDYLLHETSDESSPLGIKQVEFNTIACSFGALSDHAAKLHKYLLSKTNYFDASPLLTEPNALPLNHTIRDLAKGLAVAHETYLTAAPQEGSAETRILFVVQDGERNVFDQLGLEWELFERTGIQSIRQTFAQVASNARIDDSTPQRRLFIRDTLYRTTLKEYEISVVYYRSAYAPTDYPTSVEWDTREMLERSFAIKCPSLALQLAGAKKVQQVLAQEGVLDEFLLNRKTEIDDGRGGKRLVRREDVEALRQTFTDLFPMDDSPLGRKAQELARTQPEKYVLKPQREGGGNNIYRENIPSFLKQLEEEDALEANKTGSEPVSTTDSATSASRESQAIAQAPPPPKREAYILMSLIDPPQHLQNFLVKGGSKQVISGPIVSELGVYGIAIFKNPLIQGGERKAVDLVYGSMAGTLLRTKGRESDEGGVAVGYSVVDSVFLV